MKVVWTKHAEDRQKEWEKKLGVSRQEVEATLKNPEQVVPGDRGVLIAQTKRGAGLLRVPFLKREQEGKVLTVYWTSKVEKYWEEKQNEN